MTNDPIGPTDRLVMILREKLREKARSSPGTKSKSVHHPPSAPDMPLGVSALSALGAQNERAARRALVQALLSDRLGAALVNDVRFQHVVSRVAHALEDDPDTAKLFGDAFAELRRR